MNKLDEIYKKEGELGFMDVWYPIQVKQKDKVGRPDIDSFEAVMMREDRTKGFFVSFDYSGIPTLNFSILKASTDIEKKIY